MKGLNMNKTPVVLLVICLLTSFAVSAGEFPSRSIKIIVPWDAGGGTDAIARALAQSGTTHLGVNVTVENKPGGSGAVGLGETMQARADGYTLAILPVELGFMKRTGIYPFSFDNFTMIMNLNTDPAALTVKAGKFKNLQEFIDFAKANPKKLKVGHSGTGLLWHLAAAVFAKQAGIELTYVPFSGAAPAQAALIGEQIDAVTVSGAEVSAQVRAGELTMLACMGDSRLAIFPDIPTMKELGIDINVNTFRGLGGPAGIPPERVAILQEGFKKMMEDPIFIELMGKMGLGIDCRDAAGYKKLAEDTSRTLSSTIEELGLATD